ncbi:MAG: hypothetical protein V1775_08490 [Bacteroidota bacterium]
MKTKFFLTAGFLLLLLAIKASCEGVDSKQTALQQKPVDIICAPELYELTVKWASEYSSVNPGAEIRVINAADNNSIQSSGDGLRFCSGYSPDVSGNEPILKMALGRNVIVPVMNAGNPYMHEIMQKGISPQLFNQIFKDPEKRNWGSVVKNGQNSPVHLFITNDETTKAGLTGFLQEEQLPIAGITVANQEEVLSALQNDPYAIAFCNLVSLINQENQHMIENISLLPIDKNGNGHLDYIEDIYGDLNLFMRGVWIGKYPNALHNNIYAISQSRTANEGELAFLEWVITEGQQFINSNGYCELVETEIQSQLNKINTSAIIITPPERKYSLANTVLIVLAALIVLGLVISLWFRRNYANKKVIAGTSATPAAGFDVNSVSVPKGLFFDKTHTWAFMESDGAVRIGIDDFIQHITGPISRIDMKKPGEKIKKGDLLFSIIQSGKQLNMYAPVSGTIKKQNEVLMNMSAYLNEAPYSEGWVYIIEPSNWLKDIQVLDMAERYERFLQNEFTRVKDFLAATLKPESLEYSHVVLQDGGQIMEGVLAEFGPEVWDDFQTDFLDHFR